MTEQSLYLEARTNLREGLEEQLEWAEERVKTLGSAIAQLGALESATALCPFCRGEMFDLGPLHEIDCGHVWGYPLVGCLAGGYHHPRPRGFECSKCGVYECEVVELPQEWSNSERRWIRGEVEPSRRALARLIFDVFPFVSEVLYYKGTWVVITAGNRYFMDGLRADVEAAWGLG